MTSRSPLPSRPWSTSKRPTSRQRLNHCPPWPSAGHLRHARHLRAVLPDHAEQVLADPAWPALAAALTQAETAGHDPQQLLQHAARQRSLDDARSPARTLTWRIQRLGTRPAPSEQARAAQAGMAAIGRPGQPAASANLAPSLAHQLGTTAARPRRS